MASCRLWLLGISANVERVGVHDIVGIRYQWLVSIVLSQRRLDEILRVPRMFLVVAGSTTAAFTLFSPTTRFALWALARRFPIY